MGIFDIFSNKDAQDAANAKIAGLQQGYNSATGALTAGNATAQGNLTSALGPWAALAGPTSNAYSAYTDALGLNGPTGNANAIGRFQSSPGYNYQVSQGLDAVDRGAAARGALSSGGTLAAEQTLGSNLANQNWGNYLQSFNPIVSQAPTVAQGQSGVYGNMAGLNYATGQQLGQYGMQLGTGIGDANAAADMAKYNASANMWGAIFNGGKLLASAAGGGGGLGNMFGGGGGGGESSGI